MSGIRFARNKAIAFVYGTAHMQSQVSHAVHPQRPMTRTAVCSLAWRIHYDLRQLELPLPIIFP
jgi:hypothetical protein